MTPGISELRALAAADLPGWAGLPAELTLDAARAELVVVPDITGRARLGERRTPVSWIAAESSVYEGGLRLYVEEERVVLIEGRDPVTASGEPLISPELGTPESVHDAPLGPAIIAGGEHVYAARGLAVQVSPETQALLAVLVFAPTTVADYVERLRPEVARWSRVPAGQRGGSSW